MLNKKHPTIKFTAEWSKTQINFLDVTVYLENGKIKTDLYVKPTDTHQYLHSSSCHLCHCKKGIPYTQTIRLNRICSDSRSFDRICNDLKRWLLERGYKEKEVRKRVLDREGRSKPCEVANCSCEVCESVKDITKFKKAESEKTFDILKGPLDCNSNNVIYLFECKKCQFKFPYVGSTVTKFRFRFNNYKSTHRKFRKKI